MTFLNPIILLGLAAAAVPLIIHLFNFRKPRKVDFSSLAFLKEVEKSTMRRVRIKQWLLLALRTLAIAALVLSFARPTLRGDLAGAFAGASPVAVTVVVDNSPSMTQRNAGGAYFDQAVAIARGIVADTDPRDEVAVVAVQGDGEAVFGPGGEVALGRLGAIGIESGTRSQLGALHTAMVATEASASQNREIYLIGDLQRSTLVDSAGTRLPGETTVQVIPIGSGVPQNVSVHDVEVRSRIVEADQPVRIAATLTNHGSTDADGYVTSLYLDGVRMAQATTNLAAGESEVVEFSASPSHRGWLEGVVETEDDAFPEDNRAYFALMVPEQRSVLVISGEGSDTRFLQAALAADDRVSLDVSKISERDISAVDLSSHDVVVLVGPETLSSGEADRIASYVSAGGGLLWFPGATATVEDYNGLFARMRAGTVRPVETAPSGAALDAVDRVDLEHPLFDGVLDASSGRLESPDIIRRMAYSPGRTTESSVMQLSSGAPFLQEIRHGRGTVLFLAVAPDPSWSDLPTRGLFIPLVYRSIFLLSSEFVAGERFAVGAAAEVLVPGLTEATRISFTGPDGQEAAPLTRTGVGGTLVDLTGLLNTAGIYRLSAQDNLIRLVAANVGPAESALGLASAAEAADILQQYSDAPVEPVAEASTGDLSSRIADTRRGAELWNVFMVMALLFLAAEMVVAKQWRPESASP